MTDEKKKVKNKKEKVEKQEIEETVEAGKKESSESETVTIPLKDYAGQLEELDNLHQKVDEFSDGWQRERAEFANYRKRMERDHHLQKQNKKIDVIKKYLVIHDDLDRAIKAVPQDSCKESWFDGMKLINQKLKIILDGEGISLIPAENTAFNPELHEAISNEENENFESGQIIEVIQQGYAIGDRVIRPALVRVAK